MSTTRPGGDGFEHDRTGADARIAADDDVAENGGPGSDQHAGANLGMPVAGFLARSAQGDVLQDRHIVVDCAGLADHDAGRMIEEDADSELGGRMKVDLQHARYAALQVKGEFPTPSLPERVSESVSLKCEKALRMEKNVKGLGGRRITVQHGDEIEARSR